jgi:amino acid transporter
MNRQGQSHSGEDVLALAAVLLVGAAVAGAFLLDHVPWLLPWAVIALLFVLIAGVIARVHGHVRPRVPVGIFASAAIIAAVTWGAGFGARLNRDTRRQLRARPAAAVAAYERQHTHPGPHTARRRRSGPGRDHRADRRHAQANHHDRQARARLKPSAAARLYGVRQLGRWHWPRIITGWSLLLGAPLVLVGIAAGLGVGLWRQRATGPRPPAAHPGAGSLRTAGR